MYVKNNNSILFCDCLCATAVIRGGSMPNVFSKPQPISYEQNTSFDDEISDAKQNSTGWAKNRTIFKSL